ncbi:MAG: preprotein translocase subunit SecA [Cytophagales bacterium]|nr:preprotein translocase subunit SecA [Cytophagales bacterium]MDW8384486.1 preprotein translocase subunit SecA [Flammeovirgaceae bacterium]
MFGVISQILTKIFGTKSEKDLKELMPIVEKINAIFSTLHSLSDDDLRQKTFHLKEKINAHLASIDAKIQSHHQAVAQNFEMDYVEKEKHFKAIDNLEKERNKELEKILMQVLPEAFAVVKETARRFKENGKLEVKATEFDKQIAAKKSNVQIQGEKAIWLNEWIAAGNPIKWDMVHYDVQLIGGIVLHQGKIAEMATGEGKTLVATLPAYLNALAGKGVHIVTVNDYLARRDCEWMGPLMEFHCITVDCIDKYQPNSEERRRAYAADITYGTNNEFGFDYLRDNMARSKEEVVQRRLHYAMVDEVDSVLIDDARTPLIISGPVQQGDEELYQMFKSRVVHLIEEQKKLVNSFLNEARRRLTANLKDEEGGLALFRAYRGMPKYKPLIKFLSEPGIKTVLQKTESFYLQDNAREMPKADEPLLFTIDERHNTIDITEKGIKMITKAGEDENFFILPNIPILLNEIENDKTKTDQEKVDAKEAILQEYAIKSNRIHAIHQLLKAYMLFERDKEYVVIDGKVKIVDEQTGRIMEGRRYSDGLHQAIEAKEGVKIEEATQTYATITLQNYFRMYHKLAGMTGTAETEATEFWDIYKLDVVVIPTNKPCIRIDHQDKVYKTVREKYNAVVQEIQDLIKKGRPVLVGTTSVENSEILSRMLQRLKIEHEVLNAKHHAREAEIVARAGQPSAVTIATNMAGRGTDIKLHPDAKKAGGLAIIGTERHESRRVDRQLRGRSGRQGDPGSSQFFVSLEDNLMRLFGSERIAKVMDRLGMEEGEVIQHPIITRSIERAQRKVEENNFAMRKRLLEYDDVMNNQRNIIYKRRRNALYGERLSLDIMNLFVDVAYNIIETSADFNTFKLAVLQNFNIESPVKEEEFAKMKKDVLAEKVFQAAHRTYQQRCKNIIERALPVVNDVYLNTPDKFQEIIIPFTNGKITLHIGVSLKDAYESQGRAIISRMEQVIVLFLIDQNWKEHLREMDNLKQQVQNAVFEQKDPLLVYKFEAFELFKRFLGEINMDTLRFLTHISIEQRSGEEIRQMQAAELARRAELEKRRKAEERKIQTEKAHIDSSLQSPDDWRRIAQLAKDENLLSTKRQPIISPKTFNRNDKVTVRYADGTIKTDVKYKNVEDDILNNKCVIINT